MNSGHRIAPGSTLLDFRHRIAKGEAYFVALDSTAALEYLVRRLQAHADLRSVTGLSSDAMVLSVFTGRPVYKTEFPRDRSDWRRCLLAYALAPPFIRELMRPTMRAYRANLDPKYLTWTWPVKRPALWMVLDNEKAVARV